MELKFLGKGGAFNANYGNTTTYIIVNNNLILIDCGETVFLELQNRFNLGDFNNIYVLLTHMHCDHVGSLGTLVSYCYYVHNKIITIIHPSDKIIELLYLMGVEKDIYIYYNKNYIKLEEIDFNFIKTIHVDNMDCYGIEISNALEVIYYSGDANIIPEQIYEKFNSNKISLIYQDVSISSNANSNHMILSKLEDLIELKNRGKIYCMHLDKDSETQITKKGFNCVKVY